ncbi:MAG TPA: peptidylprolyl isomerase [Roseiflexaceae bacterium]|nr:peptidylprolyl isomerase [Roseiflexaceae bacterium]
MSQSTRGKKATPAPQQPRSSGLGALAAVVVVAVFVVLGLMLARPSAEQAAAQPTPLPFDAVTPVPEAPASAAPTPVPAGDTGAQPGADVAARANKYSAPPPMMIDPSKSYTATITTPRGDIVIKLRPDLAPQTVNSFVFLAREGFYDGTTWHRVLPDFMAQGGDPTGTGAGGPGYNVPAEFTDKVLFDRPGIVAMARSSDPDSAGSQFFITTAPAPHLNQQYTVFGEVVEGQDIVNGIPLRDPATATAPGEQIVKVTVSEG